MSFRVGPVASDLALAWIDNSRALLHAVRRGDTPLSISAHEDLLDLCDSLLSVWAAHASRSETFDWSMDIGVDQLTRVAQQWLEIGRLTDDELARLGVSWAPPWTRPFADALTAGVLTALEAAGEDGAALAERLRPSG